MLLKSFNKTNIVLLINFIYIINKLFCGGHWFFNNIFLLSWQVQFKWFNANQSCWPGGQATAICYTENHCIWETHGPEVRQQCLYTLCECVRVCVKMCVKVWGCVWVRVWNCEGVCVNKGVRGWVKLCEDVRVCVRGWVKVWGCVWVKVWECVRYKGICTSKYSSYGIHTFLFIFSSWPLPLPSHPVTKMM